VRARIDAIVTIVTEVAFTPPRVAPLQDTVSGCIERMRTSTNTCADKFVDAVLACVPAEVAVMWICAVWCMRPWAITDLPLLTDEKHVQG
jgi:hypothetical protein